MRVKVNDGTQVNHRGTVHEAGAVFEADEAEAEVWLRDGLVSVAKRPSRPPGPTKQTAKRSPAKRAAK